MQTCPECGDTSTIDRCRECGFPIDAVIIPLATLKKWYSSLDEWDTEWGEVHSDLAEILGPDVIKSMYIRWSMKCPKEVE